MAMKIGVAIVLALIGVADAAAEKSPDIGRATWDQCIEAKGGRERLYSVQNVLLSSTSTWGFFPFKRITVSYEHLYALPDRFWMWSDERPSVFGVALRVADLSKGLGDIVYGGAGPIIKEARPPLSPGKPSPADVRRLREIQTVLFLQTRWVQPFIVGTKTVSGGRVRISTFVEGQLFEFVIPRSTHLPERVVTKTPVPSGFATTTYVLSEYRPINGIMLPHKITMIEGPPPDIKHTLQVSYLINVEHDPELFDRRPSLAAGPKGWMRRN